MSAFGTDQVTFPPGADIISAAEGGVRLFVETIALAEECRELYFDRWDPRGYGSRARITPTEEGTGFIVDLSRYLHCD